MNHDELTEVEKRFVDGLLEALTPGQKLWTSEQEKRQYIREAMKIAAYHEAGHFVARAFTRLELSHIVAISIIPDSESAGRLTAERPFTMDFLEHYPQEIQRANGIFLLLYDLAGYRVEMILNGTERETIFDYIEEIFLDYEEAGSDFKRVCYIARILSRPYMPAYRILTLADRWTAEMLKIPSVWQGIEKVAGLLLARGEITDGDEIYQLSRSLNIPFIYDLPRWKRRLCFTIGGSRRP